MNTGLLWFDNSKLSLADKVRKAAQYYKKKYGRAAEVCLVNPSMMGDEKMSEVEGITVRAWRPVLPGHLWIGIEDATGLSEPKTERESDLDGDQV